VRTLRIQLRKNPKIYSRDIGLTRFRTPAAGFYNGMGKKRTPAAGWEEEDERKGMNPAAGVKIE
jgi:hypothetical protein